ncbi:hypothetical protein [Actinacidiphila paucisporea]|uniref:Uncharacterized protein n=1 Tax=Actinacidiphila paucisporea TaxID=310782 RepID=A0A1M6U2X3_9ACTN|nr:hypothetical protein [Actinacidiphila paucisporea]SHK63513.1 hypothetical protein SAMN05216499_101225 [Actinacidiphila paucisporea]
MTQRVREFLRRHPCGNSHTRAAETAELEGFSVGYQRLESGLAFIAAVNVDPAEFAIRKVKDWSAYDIDARTGFPLSALNR